MDTTSGYDVSPLIDPHANKWRRPKHKKKVRKIPNIITYMFLLFTCAFTFGDQAWYDTPSSLGRDFLNYYNINELEYGLLYTINNAPNMILVFMVGASVNWLGPNTIALLSTLTIFIGGTIMYMESENSYPHLLIGFLLTGIGSGNALAAQNAILTRWFKSNLAFALGLSTTLGRIQVIVDCNVVPQIARNFGFHGVVMYPWIVSMCSFFFTVIVLMLNYFRFRGRKRKLDKNSSDFLNCDGISKLPFSYWLVVLLTCCISLGFFLFEIFAVLIFQEYDYDVIAAARMVSFASLALIIVSPLAAWFADTQGYSGHVLFISGVMQFTTAVLIILPDLNVISPTSEYGYLVSLMAGTGYAVGVSVMWNIVTLFVPEEAIATSYSILNGCVNICLCIFPVLFGFLAKHYKSFYTNKLIFIGFAGIAILAATAILLIDAHEGGNLTSPAVHDTYVGTVTSRSSSGFSRNLSVNNRVQAERKSTNSNVV